MSSSACAIAHAPDTWLTKPFREVLRRSGMRLLPPVLAATLMITILALALPLALLQVYDRILPNASLGTLTVLALVVIMALLLEALLRIVRGNMLARIAAIAEAQAHRQAMEHVLRAPTAALTRHGNGYYAERLSAIGTLREAWSGPAMQAMLDLPFALLYLLALGYLAGSLALVPLAALAGMAAVAWHNGRRVRQASRVLSEAEERRFNFLFDALHAAHSVKILGAERLLERRYDRLQGCSAKLRNDVGAANAAGQESGLLLAQLATLGVAAMGCLMVLAGQLSVGGLGACTMLTGRTMQPLLGGIALWARLQSLAEARRRIAEISVLPQEPRPDLPALTLAAGRVSLQGIRAGALGPDTWLFADLDLEVAPGEMVGITGANGSGRSTLLRLIAGEVRPAAGRVCIDGQDLAAVDPPSTRPGIALVPPDPALVRGTLLQNLTLYQPHLEEEALALALQLGLDQVAGQLPGGWHTQVGTAATPLPRGVSQRIGVVRALLQAPRILLLDDVTAQLDSEGDVQLAQLLSALRGQVTVVIVTHRRSTLGLANRVLTLHQGRLEPVL